MSKKVLLFIVLCGLFVVSIIPKQVLVAKKCALKDSRVLTDKRWVLWWLVPYDSLGSLEEASTGDINGLVALNDLSCGQVLSKKNVAG